VAGAPGGAQCLRRPHGHRAAPHAVRPGRARRGARDRARRPRPSSARAPTCSG
jgi:hypothetical protein